MHNFMLKISYLSRLRNKESFDIVTLNFEVQEYRSFMIYSIHKDFTPKLLYFTVKVPNGCLVIQFQT